jgi:hypothetical protein
MNEPEKDEAASIGAFLKKAFAPAISEMEEMLAKRNGEGAPTPPPEPPRLFAQPHWLISGVSGFGGFFGALTQLVPPGSSLRIEGNPYPDVEEGLRPWLTDPSRKTGRFWRTLAKYVLPVTTDNMAELARMAARHAEPEVADHFQVLYEDEPILHWYDAPSDPIYVSDSLDEAKIAMFAQAIGGTMKKEAGSAGI